MHRSTSNRMDISPDIDPTEISRILWIAITVHRPSQGGRKGFVNYGSSGDNNVGQAGEVHICQYSVIQQKEKVTITRIVGKRRRIRLESLGHGRNQPDACLS